MLVKVPTIRTSYTVQDLVKALILGWHSIYNTLPSKSSIAVIYAQFGVETSFGKACWCWNLGNVKAVDHNNETVAYCVLNGVFEMVNGKRIEVPPTSSSAWFRAFPTLESGVSFYINFLRNNKYASAWQAVEQGNPTSFSHLLKMQGYYTADENLYTSFIMYHYNNFMKDTIFEKAIEQVPQIIFPTDYTPLEFPTVEDTATKPNNTSQPGEISNWFTKLRSLI